jgi:Na+/H+-dicarboxylate symporter
LEIGDLVKTVEILAYYVFTVVCGLFIHQFVTLPAILFLSTRRNPYKFMRGLLQASLTALGTASSAASL